MKRLIFVTGPPGIGKTSITLRVVETLSRRGYVIGGMITREVRESGVRVGFEIVDLYTQQRGLLAHVNQPAGPRISRYRVNLNALKEIGYASILNALSEADVVVVDEIGPMELFSLNFKKAVFKAVSSKKPMLGTLHRRTRDPIITTIKGRRDAEILKVTYENRESLHNTIINKVIQYLQKLP